MFYSKHLNRPIYRQRILDKERYATDATPYILSVIFFTDKLSFKDNTTLPRTRVGVDSISDGVMTMTSFELVPILYVTRISICPQNKRDLYLDMGSHLMSKSDTAGPPLTPLTLPTMIYNPDIDSETPSLKGRNERNSLRCCCCRCLCSVVD